MPHAGPVHRELTASRRAVIVAHCREIRRAPPPLCSKQGCLQSPWAPPVTKWLAEYNVRENLRADIIAGVTIAIMVGAVGRRQHKAAAGQRGGGGAQAVE